MAAKQGLRLEKSRRRDPDAWDYATYQRRDAERNLLVYANWAMQRPYGLDLDDIEAWLSESEMESSRGGARARQQRSEAHRQPSRQ